MAISSSMRNFSVAGNRAHVIADITFGSSYPEGGEPINTDQLFGVHTAEMALIEPSQGYSFQYDYDNDKIKVFAPAPPIVYDEVKVMDDDYQITTNYPCAFIMNLAAQVENIKLRSTGIAKASLTAGEASLTAQMAAGERTTIQINPINQVTDAYSAIGAGTGWTAGTDWSFSGNKAVKAAGAGSGTLSLDETFPIAGHTYRVVYTISSLTAGGVTPSIGGASGTAVTADGTYTEDILATASAGKLTFAPASDLSAFSLDDAYAYDLTCYITYITQAWREVWDNLVQDETKTLATGANNLTSGNKIAACMYIDQTTTTAAALTMIDSDDTVASGEVDLLFNSATAQFTVHSDQNAKAVKTTYLKVPSSGFLLDRLFTNESATKAGGDPYINTFDYPILLWGYTGCMPVNGGATLRVLPYHCTPATGDAVIDWYGLGARGAAAPAVGTEVGVKDNVTGTAAGIWGRIPEIQNLLPLEVQNGVDLSGLTIRMLLIGT